MLSTWSLMQGEDSDPVSDQWLEAFMIVDDDGKPVGTIQDDDAVSRLDCAYLPLLRCCALLACSLVGHGALHCLPSPINQ